MKNFRFIFVALMSVVCLLGFSSCEKDDDGFNSGDYWLQLSDIDSTLARIESASDLRVNDDFGGRIEYCYDYTWKTGLPEDWGGGKWIRCY